MAAILPLYLSGLYLSRYGGHKDAPSLHDYFDSKEEALSLIHICNLDYTDLYDKRDYLNLAEWSVADVNGDLAQCGLSGSPTKVKADVYKRQVYSCIIIALLFR